MIYEQADDVRTIAAAIIPEHHPHLVGIRMEFVWREKATVKGGVAVLGKARKVTGLHAFLSRPDTSIDWAPDYFVIEIAQDTWQFLSEEQREALIDHELCHCTLDEGELALHPHDVEEFAAIVRRHGLWKPALLHLSYNVLHSGYARSPLRVRGEGTLPQGARHRRRAHPAPRHARGGRRTEPGAARQRGRTGWCPPAF